jgi:hypothetical protein
MSNRKLFISLAVFMVVTVAVQVTAFSTRRNQTKAIETRFTVRIENISDPAVQVASNGMKWPFAVSPGFWIVHEKDFSLFVPGKRVGTDGLEAQAEDGNPSMLLNSLMMHHASAQKGVFNTPLGDMKPGPIGPGGTFEFSFTAKPGMHLSFTTMFGQSNDLFYAPDKGGIALFDDKGASVTGDVTSRIKLWDAGTEVNQEPGVGTDQAPRQKAANTGTSENKPVGPPKDKFYYPATNAVMRVSIMSGQ